MSPPLSTKRPRRRGDRLRAVRILTIVLFIACILTLGACGERRSESTGPVPTDNTGTPGEAEGGFGTPAQSPGEFDTAQRANLISGQLRQQSNGCWTIDINGTERLAVFPVGFTIAADDGTALVGSRQQRYTSGMTVDGIVRFVFESKIPGGTDGKWGNYLAFCQPDLAELVVFDELDIAFDPTALTPDELRSMVEAADFTESWPCGRGWAISTADQRVGIFIYQRNDEQPSPQIAVGLADPAWSAELAVGKFLFVQNCDDAIEEWEPLPIRAATWPITGGTITLLDPAPAPEDPPKLVRAVLSGAVVATDLGDYELPELELVNSTYNAFAG